LKEIHGDDKLVKREICRDSITSLNGEYASSIGQESLNFPLLNMKIFI